MEVALPYLYLLVVIVTMWSVLGFSRGATPEAVNLAGIFVAGVVVAKAGDGILERINKLVRSVIFLAQGGIEAENPSALVRSLSDVRLVDRAHPEVGLAVLFVAIVGVFFLLSRRLERQSSIPIKTLGALVGAINGYMAAYIVFQAPSQRAQLVMSIGLPAARNADPLGPYLAALVIAAVGIVIVVGLAMSMRASRRIDGTQFAGKRRG